MSRLRSALFVPATRTDRILKAFQSGADQVIVDLEDAVAPAAKNTAREDLRGFVQAYPEQAFMLRMNSVGTPWFADDLRLCSELSNISAIMLPKAESAEDIQRLAQLAKPIYPIIESARGIQQLAAIAHAPGVARLSFGALDLGVDLRMVDDSEGARCLLNQVRAQIVIQSRLAGIPAPLDGVFPNIVDMDGLAAAVQFAQGMGFAGALCIHPTQVEVIHRVLAPSVALLDWAQRVVDEAQNTGLLAFTLDGKMVDKPVIDKAKQILLQADD